VLAKGEHIVPIPGTKRVKYLEENVGATAVRLSPDEVRELDHAIPPGAAQGGRYAEGAMRMIERD
jgi:aryl-alcohol dehydrogenase-like predicted oxidoreductase